MADRLTPSRALASRWFDPALAVLVTGVALIELFARPELTNSLRAPIAVILFGSTLAVRRSHPIAGAGLQAAVLLATPNFDDNFLPGTGVAAAAIMAYSCGAHAAFRDGLAAVAVLAASMQIGMGFSEFPNFEVYFATLGPWWVGLQVERRRSVVRELRARTAQLEAEQDAFARLAVRRERARIARELHDIVGHHLAVVVVQAGAGRMAPVAQREGNAERFASIRESGGHALEEMARLVDLLDAERANGDGVLARLRVLIDEAAAGGIRVGFTPLPVDVHHGAEIEDAAYRVVQEAMTNAIKHAPGADLRVRLQTRDDELEIEVHNETPAAESRLAGTGSGLGLAGMRERVDALGGSLEAGPTADGGWCLTARLPIGALEVAAPA
jgi:signal transduction histidine kinase